MQRTIRSLSATCFRSPTNVCDVYDALRTNRPYRDAWPADKVLACIEERSGVEFDGKIAHAFAGMMREWEPRVARVTEDETIAA